MDASIDETLTQRFQRGVSLNRLSEDVLTSISSTPSVDPQRVIRSAVLSVAFGLFGCYFPRYLIRNETSIIHKTPPYQVTAAGDVILDFALNEKAADPPIVDSPLLLWTAIFLPLLLTATHAYLSSRGRPQKMPWLVEVCTVLAAFSMAMGLSEGTTQLLKLWIQRRRPSFYDICGFDKETLTCTASLEHQREATFSFPSGHSSLSCCGMTFLVWYMLGTLRGRRRWMQFGVAVVSWGWSIFVGASRLVDKWHHPSDVLAGLGLGFATCTIAYHTWYPPVWSPSAGYPRMLLKEGDASSSSKLPSFND